MQRKSLAAPVASMDGNINTLFNNLATDIRNVSVAVGVFAFMWGALQYATSGGSPHQLELGKTAMKRVWLGWGRSYWQLRWCSSCLAPWAARQPGRASDEGYPPHKGMQ